MIAAIPAAKLDKAAIPAWAVALSFGFSEFAGTYRGTKTITLTNHGTTDVRFTASNEAGGQSRPASVTF